MEKWRHPVFFPMELGLFYLLFSSAWLFLIWQVGIPYVQIAARHPLPFLTPEMSSAVDAGGFALVSMIAVAGVIGFGWWKLTLKAHCESFLRLCASIFNLLFRNAVPPMWMV